MNATLTLSAILLLTTFGAIAKPAPELARAWQTEPVLMTCESALLNPADHLLYVSCIDGAPAEKNGTGFIAKVDLEGKIHTLKWAEGFNAPKGMAIQGGILYVSDIDELVQVSLNKGIFIGIS